MIVVIGQTNIEMEFEFEVVLFVCLCIFNVSHFEVMFVFFFCLDIGASPKNV